MIAGYVGNRTTFDEAIGEFAMQYSVQTDHDHDSMALAVRKGRLEAASTQ